MSVCLTGDVHDASMRSREQRFTKLSEPQIALDYLTIAERFGIKVTLFLTGKAVNDQIDQTRKMKSFKGLEIGGHTYNALRPLWLHRVSQLTLRSYYGPSWYQKLDIKRTVMSIANVFGRTPVSWRTHGYRSDSTTVKCLGLSGNLVLSDKVNPNLFLPYRISGEMWSLPINTMPDHEHIIHADRTSARVSRLIREGWSDEFTNESYSVNEWFKQIKNEIIDITGRRGVATVLAHPLCMFTSDRLQTFSKVCEFLSGYQTRFVQESPNMSP